MKARKDILFLGLHRPSRSPSQRYRIEQFLPYLKEEGLSYDYDYLLSEEMDRVFYSPGALLGKAWLVVKSIIKLCYIAFVKSKDFHYVFVQREAFMLGTAFFEKVIAKRSKLIFDFDDSIWMPNVSEANKKLSFLKNPNKVKEIIEKAHYNVTGNLFLSNYASQYSNNVMQIPTCVDTYEYQRSSPLKPKQNGRVCIGWSGSQTTIEHFKLAQPVLSAIKKKYGDKVYFKVLGDGDYSNEELNIQGVKWERKTEIQELEELDIGIMPLPNDEWSKGKCGLKGLVYMSMEIPSILADVGVNAEIIQDGVNGYLCANSREWQEKLSLLIENEALRETFGKLGRETILDKYSILANKEGLINLIRDEK
ncbi:MAG: glycosyltransferase involved in cell wall biosynthesis [Chitinophagales bacterium]